MKDSMIPNRSFSSIQFLRGLAACIVVIHHATQQLVPIAGKANLRVWENGASGVDIFFIISGFVMAVSTLGREDKHHPARVFFERRLIRLVPMYWLLTSTFVALLAYHLHKHGGDMTSVNYSHVDVHAIVCSLLFIPYRNTLGNIQPLLVVGWTLSYEMFFYLLFTLALAMRKQVVTFLTPILVTFAIIGFFRQESWPAVTVLASPLLLEFAAGLLLGSAVLRGYVANRWVATAAGLVSLAVLLFLPVPANFSALRILQWGASAVMVVHAGIAWESKAHKSFPRWMLLLGDASYSLYLAHMLVLTQAVALLSRSGVMRFEGSIPDLPALLICVCVLAALLVAVPLYLFVEKPLTDALRRLTAGTSPLRP